MTEPQYGVPSSKGGRFPWAAAFLILNAVGLAWISWQVHSLRRPAGMLVVLRAVPDDAVSISDPREFRIEYGAPLDPETVRSDTLSLKPTLRGRTVLEGERTLRLLLEEPARRATRYRVEVSPDLRGRLGEQPPVGAYLFHTPPLALVNLSQASVEADHSTVLAFSFNAPVSPQDLARHCSLTSPEGTPVLFEPVGAKPSATVMIRVPRTEWDSLQVVIPAGLTGVEGPLPLEAEVRRTVAVSTRLRIAGVNAHYDWDGRAYIEIRTNSPVDVQAARPFVVVEPDVHRVVEAWERGLRIVGDFQPGCRYRILLRAGLPAGAAEPLARDLERTAWFPDRPEGVRFPFEGGYLSPKGLRKVPLRTVNLQRIEVGVRRLYPSNLPEYVLGGRSLHELGIDLGTREIAVEGERNEDVETLLSLDSLAGGEPLGVYGIHASTRGGARWDADSTLAVVTDLGLDVRLSDVGAAIWVTSLVSSRPVEGATVTLYSNRRQEIASAFTGGDGVAAIDLRELPRGEAPALVVARLGNDTSYLELYGSERPRGKEAAEGRPYLDRGYEAFVFAERGAYRPGDTVHLCVFVRGRSGAVPDPIPLETVVLRPDGRVLDAATAVCDAAGRLPRDAVLPRDAQGGRYVVFVRVPGTERRLGSCAFHVADYIPPTLRVRLEAPATLSAPGPLALRVEARHLFGDPARGLPAACRIRFDPAPFEPAGWDGYRFGDVRRGAGTAQVDAAAVLDETGAASFEIAVPDVVSPAAVRAVVEAEVREAGGRALVETASCRIDPWPFYVGACAPQAPAPGVPSSFGVAAVAPDGASWVPAGVEVRCRATLLRVQYGSVLRREGRGRLVYDWVRTEEPVGSADAVFAAGRAEVSLTPPQPGSYRLLVESEGGCAAVLDFYVSGPGGVWAGEDPEALDLALDRAAYRPGDTATLRVTAPFAGTALVTVESDRVLERRVENLPAGESSLRFDVKEAWRPNVHLAVTLVRPVVPEEIWRPHRASGSARLRLDTADRRLDLLLETPAQARPGADLQIRVRTAPGAAVVVAAVDEGVLGLTRFETPSPLDFFLCSRSLGVREYDLYSRLCPENAAWRVGSETEPGGGEAVDGGIDLARRLSTVDAKRVRTAVLYAGGLVADGDGIASCSFRVPEYLGELRVMAFAACGDRYGSAAKALAVRSPVMLRASWPRFAAPGDEFDVPVTLFNRTEADGRVGLSLALEGPLQAARKITDGADVPAGGEATVSLRVRATGTGVASIRLTASLAGESCGESVEIPVRVPAAFARRAGSAVVEGAAESRVSVEGEFLPGTARCSVVVGGSVAVELSGAIGYLLDYPYGCAEQTVSRMVPLVYLPDLAALCAPGQAGPEEVREILDACLLRLRMMQTHTGGLSMWPGESEPWPWGSLYAAEVLEEARRAGHEVPEDLRTGLLDYAASGLDDWVGRADWGTQIPPRFAEAAYAAYVLSRAGRTPHGWLARLEEVVRDCEARNLSLPAGGRFHLAAAFLAAGQGEAGKAFLGEPRTPLEVRAHGGSLESPVRETAVLLSVLLDVAPDDGRIPALVERLRGQMRLGAWGTTQENAFALLALGKHARRAAAPPDAQVVATLPDGSTRSFTAREGARFDGLEPGQSVSLRLEGPGRVYAFWSAEGVPRDGAVTEEDAGMAVRRVILEADGRAQADPAALVQGRLYQIRLTLSSDRQVGNVVVSDLLPAGLEVESPDLSGSASLPPGETVGWFALRHREMRDDRVLFFGDMQGGARTQIRYLVRAVTTGTFILPAVEASCMYDPGLYSVHGRVTVTVRP